jgi:hypothetical protein
MIYVDRRAIMFNELERKEEIKSLFRDDKDAYGKPHKIMSKCNLIVSQEKSMIEQAKKEAREEFAVKLRCLSFWKNNPDRKIILESDINKLLKEYEVL